MNIQRLQMLAELLDTVEPDSFDLEHWVKRERCGTVACAVGHACMHPPFNEMGLKLDVDPACPKFSIPTFGEYRRSWDAVIAFFDISLDIAYKLFLHSRYTLSERTPANVAARIRAVIAEEQSK